MSSIATIRILVVTAAISLAPNALALSCPASTSTLEQSVRTLIRDSDLIAIGKLEPDLDSSAFKLTAEGIWKGPNYEVYDVGFVWITPEPKDSFLFFGSASPLENDFSFTFDWTCTLLLHNIGYEELAAMVAEDLGPPRPPDKSGRNFVSGFALLIVFMALFGALWGVHSYVTLNKSFKRDA